MFSSNQIIRLRLKKTPNSEWKTRIKNAINMFLSSGKDVLKRTQWVNRNYLLSEDTVNRDIILFGELALSKTYGK